MNTMAQYSLWSRRYRESTSSAELTLYIDFLKRFIADLSRDATAGGGQETGETAALLLRARLAPAVAFVNRAFVKGGPAGRRLREGAGGEGSRPR